MIAACAAGETRQQKPSRNSRAILLYTLKMRNLYFVLWLFNNLYFRIIYSCTAKFCNTNYYTTKHLTIKLNIVILILSIFNYL